MWSRCRWLSCAGLMLVLPLHCEAQGRQPFLERALPEAVAAAGRPSSLRLTQSSTPRSGSRDSLLNGTVIGFAAGAALGIALVYATRDSELDAGQFAYSALIFGGIGAGVGLGIDALVDRDASVVLRSPRRVPLSPGVSPRAARIRLILKW